MNLTDISNNIMSADPEAKWAPVVVSLVALFISFLSLIVILCSNWKNLRKQEELNKLKMFYLVTQRMEDTRRSRHIVRDYIKKKEKEGLEEDDIMRLIENKKIPKRVENAADTICREFDILGLLDHNNCIDKDLIDKIYSVPFVPLYDDFLHFYVENLRSTTRGPAHFWELVKFYERVKLVPRNHPVNTKADDWPKYPRELQPWLYGIRKY